MGKRQKTTERAQMLTIAHINTTKMIIIKTKQMFHYLCIVCKDVYLHSLRITQTERTEYIFLTFGISFGKKNVEENSEKHTHGIHAVSLSLYFLHPLTVHSCCYACV